MKFLSNLIYLFLTFSFIWFLLEPDPSNRKEMGLVACLCTISAGVWGLNVQIRGLRGIETNEFKLLGVGFLGIAAGIGLWLLIQPSSLIGVFAWAVGYSITSAIAMLIFKLDA